jgi:hypothetical protein
MVDTVTSLAEYSHGRLGAYGQPKAAFCFSHKFFYRTLPRTFLLVPLPS